MIALAVRPMAVGLLGAGGIALIILSATTVIARSLRRR